MRRRLNMKRVTAAVSAAVLLPVGAACIFKGISALKPETVPSMANSMPTFAYTTASTSAYTEFTYTGSEHIAKHIIQSVPHINQNKDFPTGCESAAAVCLMNYYGIGITVDEFIDNHLPQSGYPYYDENGIMHGESPYEYFIGDPRSDSGYGCYAPVIHKAVEAALPEGFTVRTLDSEALTLEGLCTEYIANDHPVVIWATMEMKPAENGRSWLLPDGTEFTFIRPEHCLILTGFDEQFFYFSDPRSEEAVTSYPKDICEAAFNAMGRQAVIIEQIP